MEDSQNRDQFFGDIFNENVEAVRAQRQLGFEERTIKRVFKECGANRVSWGRLVNECRDMTGQHNLNFNWFHTAYPEFPGTLCGKRIPKLHELTLADMLKHPSSGKNRLFQAIVKTLHRQEIDTSRGFVFVFPIVRTMFCAHNIDTPGDEHPRVQWRAEIDRVVLRIEPTVSFFRTVGPAWCE